mmetsp:Transcript_48692/g.112842  ORF Transcript_48692/g.112842 Transcript_48692/m.112842 type:complete len:308 (+) Transcript_48692:628-1551(+)
MHLAGLVEGFEDAGLHRLVAADDLRLLRDESREHVLLRRALDAQHELHCGFLLLREEPLEPLTHVLGLLPHLCGGVLHHERGDGVGPADVVQARAAGLDHILRAELLPQASEAHKDLDLVHKPAELCAAVDLHVHALQLHRVAQVVDVRVYVPEARRQPLFVCEAARALRMAVESVELLFHGASIVLGRQRALHEEVEALCKGDASRTRCVQDIVLVDELHLLLDDVQALLLLIPRLLQPHHHRRQRVGEELLDLHFHEGPEVLEADGHHVLGGGPLRRERVDVHPRAVLAHGPERLWRNDASPVWQ